jgi:hypothetical protein
MSRSVDPEYTPLGGHRVRIRSQIRFDLIAKPLVPAVVLSEHDEDHVLTWPSATADGKGVIEIVHVGDLSETLREAHTTSVLGLASVFDSQGGEVVSHRLLEATPDRETWARLRE